MSAQPNIVMVLIDDLGARDLGCFGSTFYETPNLDRLAAQGMQFDRAYASCPVCSPTRASIMTGQYPARVGITQFIGGHYEGRLLDVPYLHYLPRQQVSIAAALRQGGYQCWHVGKWHLGPQGYWPEDHGFDVNIGGCASGSPIGPNHYFSPYNNPTLSDGPDGEYLTDRLTDEAIALIRRREPGRPFFLNLWHYTVHTPIQAPAALVSKYIDKAERLGLNRINPIIEGEAIPKLYPLGERPLLVRRRVVQSDPVYAAMVENLDINIGRLMQALDAEGLTDNTLVVFTSDNGGLATAEGSPTCNLPLAEGKGWAQEGGIRVSQIARWPSVIAAGGHCRQPLTSTDFYPTFLEAAGLPLRPEQHADGVSLMPLLAGRGEIDREALYWHYPHYPNQGATPTGAVVRGHMKLIEYFEFGRCELYDLLRDPSEAHDLSARLPELAAELRGLLHRWQADIGAVKPQPNPAWTLPLRAESPRPRRGCRAGVQVISNAIAGPRPERLV